MNFTKWLQLVEKSVIDMGISPAGLEDEVQSLIQDIDYEVGREIAQSQWASLKRRITVGDINREDAKDQLAAIGIDRYKAAEVIDRWTPQVMREPGEPKSPFAGVGDTLPPESVYPSQRVHKQVSFAPSRSGRRMGYGTSSTDQRWYNSRKGRSGSP